MVMFRLAKIKKTILLLLLLGADPKAVKYPLPALIMAVIGNDVDIVKNIIKSGADIHIKCPEMLNYTALEYAISQKLTETNVEIIRVLLESGAKANECLQYEVTSKNVEQQIGPTLLHAVLAKTAESVLEKDVQNKVLNLLLDYGSDPTSIYKRQSALEIAVTSNTDLLNVFIKNGNVNLNAVIDEENRTILAKLFDFNFFRLMDKIEINEIVLKLLRYGANPLLKINIYSDEFENIFEFIKNQLSKLQNPAPFSKSEAKKQNDKNKSKQTIIPKFKSTTIEDDVEIFKKAVEVLTEFTRNAHKRWLQANLTVELINIVKKFKHRHWNMIIKEHTKQKQVTLWLTAQRCLEICHILTCAKKICNDRHVLKLTLCIVHFYNIRQSVNSKLTLNEKTEIENYVKNLIRNHVLEENIVSTTFVKPELDYEETNFKAICFECSLPLSTSSIKCRICKVVSFCQIDCVRQNMERTDCHPCTRHQTRRLLETLDK